MTIGMDNLLFMEYMLCDLTLSAQKWGQRELIVCLWMWASDERQMKCKMEKLFWMFIVIYMYL